MVDSRNTADRDAQIGEQHPPVPVYDQLKEDILVGAFAPGTPLVEVQLAERYSVSRTPVRQALSRLEQDGLVERGDRSMQVRYYSAQQIYELYHVRAVLEGAAARAAAESRTEFDAAQLAGLIARTAADMTDIHERVRLNRAFHRTIWQASHNSILIEILDRLYTTSVVHMSTTLGGDERWARSLDEHRRLVEAIVDRDADTAERLVLEHLRTARDIRLKSMAAG